MALNLLKTTAIAAALVIATASTSFAATWGMINQDSVVRSNHSNLSAVVNHVDDGDMVQIIGSWGQWYKIAIPGPNGWIRKHKVELDYVDDPSEPGVQFCFTGPLGYFCASN